MPQSSSTCSLVFRLFAPLTLALIATAAACANDIHVTTTAQGDSRGLGPNGGPLCSLAEAIYAANTHSNQALDASVNLYTSGCETGSGSDVIHLTSRTYPMSDFVHAIQHGRYGPTATPVILSHVLIEGNGATIQTAPGAPNMRAFTVGFDQVDLPTGAISGWGNLELRNVTIQGFVVKGGDGGFGGGGGGMGAGGAIYVDGSGSSNVGLIVENSTFTANGAVGGNGGEGSGPYGGAGGGGLSANGGGGSFNGGGGGGGSFGRGGDSNLPATGGAGPDGSGGGGGGGTDSSGQNADASGHGAGPGFCGGAGGDGGLLTTFGSGNNGSDAPCPGGGGGGGGAFNSSSTLSGALNGGHGGAGSYGGGGGGAGNQFNNGGNGGFGGGGGGASDALGTPCLGHPNAGKGGFGGGGGGSNRNQSTACSNNGVGGRFGGDGGTGFNGGGGGGAGLGGAIFSDSSAVSIQNSTFFNNFVTRGNGGTTNCCGAGNADNGSDAGGAIFARNGSLTVQNVTFSGNQATGSGGGVVVVNDGSATAFDLDNTIIANNGAQECFFEGSVQLGGVDNLIMSNGSGTAPFSPCPNVVITADPLLAPLAQPFPDLTPTMALQAGSPAIMAADPTTSLATDQRGVGRKAMPDIGAYETGLRTSMSFSSSSNPSVYGSQVTFDTSVTSFSNSGPPTGTLATTIDGSLVTLTSSSSGNSLTQTYQTSALTVGSHIVMATYTNTGNFLGSGPSSLTQLVTQAALTITGNNGSRLIDSGNPTFSVTYAGFVNGDTAASLNGTLTCTTTANQFSPVGNYPINCSGLSSPNYSITYVPGTLSLTATSASTANLVGDILNGGCINNGGVANALTSKLSAAQAASNVQTGINTLSALKNQINAQAGQHIAVSCTINGITFSPPPTLLQDVQGLIDSMRVSTIADPITGYVVNASGVGVPGATLSILDAGGNTVAVASTDITGYYFFATTGVLVPGSSYTIGVTGLPAGFVSSTPAASPAFSWAGTGMMIGNFVLN